jgi:AraC-like DNA-binding protein
MDYLELPPPQPLEHLVHRFWFFRTGPGAGGTMQTVVPDGRCELVLHLGEPFAEADEQGRARSQARVLLAGQLTGPLRLFPPGGAEVVGIRFRSGAAGALFPLPPREIVGRVVSLEEVAPGLAAKLLDSVAPVPGRRARAQALAHALARVVLREPDTAVSAAVTRLESDPRSSIGGLGAALGLSPRTIQRRFLEDVGIGPGLLRRILRFRAAFGLLGRLPPGRWTTGAAAAGYFDQAHLIRDFRRFAGAPPSAFFRAGPDLAQAFAVMEAGAAR